MARLNWDRARSYPAGAEMAFAPDVKPWIDKHTKRHATIACRCGHTATMMLAPARLKISKLRCSACGHTRPRVQFQKIGAPRRRKKSR